MSLYLEKKKMKFKFIVLFLLLTSCGSFNEAGKALRNEKTRTTDEFLIEKRGPLSIPPKMDELPKPNSSKDVKENNKRTLESLNDNEKSAIENMLLEEIRKN